MPRILFWVATCLVPKANSNGMQQCVIIIDDGGDQMIRPIITPHAFNYPRAGPHNMPHRKRAAQTKTNKPAPLCLATHRVHMELNTGPAPTQQQSDASDARSTHAEHLKSPQGSAIRTYMMHKAPKLNASRLSMANPTATQETDPVLRKPSSMPCCSTIASRA